MDDSNDAIFMEILLMIWSPLWEARERIKWRNEAEDRPLALGNDLGFTKPTLFTIGFSARKNMGNVEINTLTMEQYMDLNRGNNTPSVVRPEIGNDVDFEIKS
uniref:Uncharacterized protein n=1 Tax=Tanacetum cinerariifolium TaxID=118510 RepID=A0A6L2MX45_TANCI|nr:hypothetical protein [Tanacetum cinerariifolium]